MLLLTGVAIEFIPIYLATNTPTMSPFNQLPNSSLTKGLSPSPSVETILSICGYSPAYFLANIISSGRIASVSTETNSGENPNKITFAPKPSKISFNKPLETDEC